MNIITAMNSREIFKNSFEDLRTWKAWQVYLKALFDLEMDPEQAQIYKKHTGNKYAISGKINKISYVLSGRRSGKSKISSLLACYIATSKDWKKALSPGEQGYIFLIANDKEQARILKKYVSGILERSPKLRNLIKKELIWEIELNNGVTIAVRTKNFRTLRGYTIIAAILEELAFWRSEESASPDFEVLAALRPAMLTVQDSMLIGISSAYAKRGLLYQQYKKFYGKKSGPLIWKSTVFDMNYTVNKEEIEQQIKEDPAKYRSEYLSEFRDDIESYISIDDLDRITEKGVISRAYDSQYKYFGFTDPSGGRIDSMTLAIAHTEGKKAILDIIEERKPPFSPEQVVQQFSEILKSFRISTVNSDRYAGQWVQEAFRKNGIHVKYNKLSASQIYEEFLPLVLSGKAVLLDNSRIRNQLSNLERKPRAGGHDSIDHPSSLHDDLAVSAAGAILQANESRINFPLRDFPEITEEPEREIDNGIDPLDAKILYPERFKEQEQNEKDNNQVIVPQEDKLIKQDKFIKQDNKDKSTARTYHGW